MTALESGSPLPPPAREPFSLVPILMIAAVLGMLGLAGIVDQLKQARGTAAATSASPAATLASAAPTSDERGRVEKIVRDYLLANPEILIDMQQVLEAKMEQQRNATMSSALKDNADAMYRRAGAPTINAQGDVTVVEFFDYNCGFCRRGFHDIAKLIETDKKVKFIFKEFPIFGKDSEAAARVALAAGAQGKYWEVHKALYEHEGKLDEAVGLAVAEKVGLDMVKLKADMNSPAVLGEIKAVRELAEKLGIQGTPHFFIGDRVIPGAPEDLYDQLAKNVAAVRETGCKVC